uniref:Endoribonuclease Dicer n=1 Tax=Rhipicephalus zambeziensis TaxID=60191 RepID=A0A224YMA0_9ACAR
MPTSSVSPSFYEWTLPVPRDRWDSQDPKLLVAARPYVHVENVLRYTFRDKGFMLQAFTHESYPESSRIVPGYMRPMDFLGDALLKEMLTVQLYGTISPLTPKALHETRKRLECNRFFGYVVVRNGMHKLMRSHSSQLSERIVQYVRKLGNGEYPGFEIDAPPKPLADIFEALVSAVYLDSDQSKSTVWRSFFPLLRSQFNVELQKTAAIADRKHSSPTNDSESSED